MDFNGRAVDQCCIPVIGQNTKGHKKTVLAWLNLIIFYHILFGPSNNKNQQPFLLKKKHFQQMLSEKGTYLGMKGLILLEDYFAHNMLQTSTFKTISVICS